MKRQLTLLLFSALLATTFAQHDPVLMTINDKPVTRSEFEYLYNKNSNINVAEKKSLTQYVDLFINYKLKVAAAEALGMDTATTFRTELNGYRRQLAKAYLTDHKAEEAYVNQVYEAWKAAGKHGTVTGKHIYIYLPQHTPKQQADQARLRMDSLYKALQTSPATDFDRLVEQYSDDKAPFTLRLLQAPEEFERVAFSLPVGQVSAPFSTPQGMHIVKLTDRKPIPDIKEASAQITQQYARLHQGLTKGDEVFLEKLKAEYNHTPNEEGVNEYLAQGQTTKTLFTLAGRSYTGTDLERFAQDMPYAPEVKLKAFTIRSLYDYEDGRLEEKHPEFKLLMQEYRDGMLMFEVSSNEVWNKAATDKDGQQQYFEKNKKKYNWELPRWKGVVVHADSKKTLKQLKKQLRKTDEGQRAAFVKKQYGTAANAQAVAEEGTYAVGDNEFVDKMVFKAGSCTPLQHQPHTLVLGRKVKGPESPDEVRGTLVIDYQTHLESTWVQELRSKSKVEINEEVLKTVNNK